MVVPCMPAACPSGDLFLMVFEGENTLGRGGLLAILLQKVARQMVLGWR